MYCEIIDFDATTCALALDSGHITHVGQLSHSTIPSGKVYCLKRSYARKSNHYHWLAFVSKEKCSAKMVYCQPTYAHMQIDVFI